MTCNNNINNQNISNGETNENDENKIKDNYNLLRRKLLLISKRNSFREKNNNNKIKTKSLTSKNLYKLFLNNKEEKIKEYKTKIKSYESRKKNKSKTFILKDNLENLSKFQKKIKNYLKLDQFIDEKNKYNNTIYKNEKSLNYNYIYSKNRVNDLLPSLILSRPSFTERQDNMNNIIESYNNKNLYKSYYKKNKILLLTCERNKKLYSPKKEFNFNNNIKIKKFQNTNDINLNESNFTKFIRKQTFNDINLKLKSNLITNKLLNNYKVYDKKNKFLMKFKKKIKEEHSNDFFENWKNLKKKEISSSLVFVKNKINNWVSEFPLNKNENEEKIIFNEKDFKTNKKDKKYLKIIIKDFIKEIYCPKSISNFYYKKNKGIIEPNILSYLEKNFFDFSLYSYIFEYKYNTLHLSKIPKKNIKILLRKKTIDSKKMKNNLTQSNSNSPKKTRRFSALEQIRKNSLANNIILPLNDIEKKSILYLYLLDIDLDNNSNENNNIENDEDKNSFLKLLRRDLNSTETQDLLINKFITIYIKNNGTKNKNKITSYNKKKSIKNSSIMNKSLNNKTPLFKNNFFSRNEIICSTQKKENIKRRKSVLEYNLLFDPSLTGYNNLITDTEKVFKSNSERAIINKRKIKEIRDLKNKQLTSFLISSGGMKTDKNIIVMKTLDLKNKYNHRNKGNINSLTSSIKDCNYDSFVKFYKACNCGPNAIDKDGNSLLSLAVKSSCLEIVNFLLKEKANPNLQNVSKIYIFIILNFYLII